MTVRFGKAISAGTLWTGVAADTKPTAAAGNTGTLPTENDLFLETDTQSQFIYIAGAWVAYDPTGGSSALQTVQGAAANGAPVSGNPVLVAGYGATSAPAAAGANGDTVDVWTNLNGAVAVMAPDYGGGPGSDANGGLNGFSGRTGSGFVPTPVATGPFLFNGTSWDRARGNVDTGALITLTTQAAGTVNSADQTNYNGKGLVVGVNITLATTASAVVTIQGKDTASGQYYTILASAALATTGFTSLTAYPSAATTANVSISAVLPRTWRISVTVTGGAASMTATIGASVIV